MKNMDYNYLNDFDSFMNSVERAELTEEQQVLLASFGGNQVTHNNSIAGCSTTNNCQGGNCVPGCGG